MSDDLVPVVQLSEIERRGPLLVVASGGTVETSFLPYRLFQLLEDFDVQVRVALSPGALDFVTVTALTALTQSAVYTAERLFDRDDRPAHLALSQAHTLLLWPATARILAQCATGQITCPVTRLFAFTPKDHIVLAPTLHPRMDRRLHTGHLDQLRALGCAVLGGDDLFCSWRDVLVHLTPRMALVPRPSPLDRLFGPRG